MSLAMRDGVVVGVAVCGGVGLGAASSIEIQGKRVKPSFTKSQAMDSII